MSIIQVSRIGSKFAVLEDGCAVSTHETRGAAVKAALDHKENN